MFNALINLTKNKRDLWYDDFTWHNPNGRYGNEIEKVPDIK